MDLVSPSELLRAAELLGEGDWEAAHEIVQRDEQSPLACWAHGIVHLMCRRNSRALQGFADVQAFPVVE